MQCAMSCLRCGNDKSGYGKGVLFESQCVMQPSSSPSSSHARGGGGGEGGRALLPRAIRGCGCGACAGDAAAGGGLHGGEGVAIT